MVKIFKVIGLVSLVMFLGGCATTRVIEQSRDLSSSAIMYTNAVNELLDVTADRVIDFDSEELKKTRYGTSSHLQEMIVEKNNAVIDVLAEIHQFRLQTRLLNAYFLNLQRYANSTLEDDIDGLIKSISDSMRVLNEPSASQSRRKTKNILKEQNYVSALGEWGVLIAQGKHSEKMKQVLNRDAGIISAYLHLQEEQLNVISQLLQDRFNAENDEFLVREVVGSYIDKTQKLDGAWKLKRKQWFKSYFISQQLATAQQAAKQLQGIWIDILQGKEDAQSIQFLISDVNEFVNVAQHLENSARDH
ncbi:MAG: hypothetical protein V4525_03245 [Pseudomonadota bacterium]